MRVNVAKHPTHPGWYYLEYRPNGVKGGIKRIPIEGYEEAHAQAAAMMQRHTSPGSIALRPRIKEVVDDYLAWCRDNQAEKTHHDKVYSFRHIVEYFGKYRPGELTQTVFDGFQRKYTGKRAAIIKYQHYLTALIAWMVKRNLADPLTFKPDKPKYHASKAVIPSMQEMQAVIDLEMDPAKKMLLITMLWTGLRWNEARLLRWEDVYLNQGTIRVRESDTEAEVHVAIYPAMQKWFAGNARPSGYVFPSDRKRKRGDDMPWTTLRAFLAESSKKIGRTIGHHDFRRRSGQNVYEATGYDVFAAQRHLRHRDIRTTMRYLGIDEQRRTSINMALVQHVDKLLNAECPTVQQLDSA